MKITLNNPKINENPNDPNSKEKSKNHKISH